MDILMVANERRDSTLSVYIIIKQVSKMIIFTKLCKVQKYFVQKSQTLTLQLQGSSACHAKFLMMTYQNKFQMSP